MFCVTHYAIPPTDDKTISQVTKIDNVYEKTHSALYQYKDYKI
jgi:hypothetical protein